MRVLSILIVLLHPNVERHYGVVAVSDGVRGDKVARLNFIGHSGHFVHRRAVRRERRRGYARKQGEHSLLEAVARSVINALHGHILRGVDALGVRRRSFVILEHPRSVRGVEPLVDVDSLGLCSAGNIGARHGS